MNARLCHAAIAVAILTGCATAPQNPIALSETAASAQGGRIGVAIAPLPALPTSFHRPQDRPVKRVGHYR